MGTDTRTGTGHRREGSVLLFDLGDGDNALTPAALDAWEAALAEVESDETITALVTVGGGKHYSNGLDLAGMNANPNGSPAYLDRVRAVLARLLELPVVTVAGVNGHAFGAGVMLVLAHDCAVMRADRGYLCLPEVDLGIIFSPFMTALIRGKLPARSAQQAATFGTRYPAPAAVAAGMVDEAVPAEEVVPRALDLAGQRGGKRRDVLAALKADLYQDILRYRPPTTS